MKKGKLIKDSSEATMKMFVECFCKSNYRSLIVSGNFTDDECFLAWRDIYYSYLEKSNTETYRSKIKSLAKIGKNEMILATIDLCLICLSYGYHKESDDLLKKYGYNYPFDEKNPEQYRKYLEVITLRSRSLFVSTEIEKANCEKAIKSENSTGMSENDFQKIFFNINRKLKFGFKVTLENTTVDEYSVMIESLRSA